MTTVVIDWCHVHGYADGGSPEEYEHHPLWETPCRLEEWHVALPESCDSSTSEEIHTVNEDFFILKKGDLAYIYTAHGTLVPCKMLSVKEDGEVEVLVTAAREPDWNRGDKVPIASPKVSLVNRSQVSRSRGRHRVDGALRFIADSGRLLP